MAKKPTPQAKKAAAAASASTQAYLNIAEIKDGVVVMKDGTLRAVLLCSSINFALKSGGEQDAIIYAYQRFLNSLTYPVQILVQSRRLDLEQYLEKLNKRAETQEVELIKLQILEYTEFIKRLITITNIMDKRFFVVVPFYPAGTKQLKGLAKLFATKPSKQVETRQREDAFQSSKVQLMQQVEAIASGLGGIGLRAVTLNSEELVELYYSIYNPSTASKQRLLNVDELTAASISGPHLEASEAVAGVRPAFDAAAEPTRTPEPAAAPGPAPATGQPASPAAPASEHVTPANPLHDNSRAF